MVAGRHELWIPARLARKELGETFTGKAAPKMLRFIRWFERHARPRLAKLLDTRGIVSLLGVVLLVFVVGAFVAPPFSGLDTLPSLGVVVVCLGLVFSDAHHRGRRPGDRSRRARPRGRAGGDAVVLPLTRPLRRRRDGRASRRTR